VKRNLHAPFWSSGRRRDPSTDCNGTRPVVSASLTYRMLERYARREDFLLDTPAGVPYNYKRLFYRSIRDDSCRLSGSVGACFPGTTAGLFPLLSLSKPSAHRLSCVAASCRESHRRSHRLRALGMRSRLLTWDHPPRRCARRVIGTTERRPVRQGRGAASRGAQGSSTSTVPCLQTKKQDW
jgi:hypothetical protein